MFKKLLIGSAALLLLTACVDLTAPTVTTKKAANKTTLAGYLVAVGRSMVCRVGSTDYEGYTAAEDADDGDVCTVDIGESRGNP